MWTSDKRLYLTPDGEVSEGPVSGGKLLVPVGGQLSDDEARSYGLLPELESKPRRVSRKTVSEPASEEPKPEDKPAEPEKQADGEPAPGAPEAPAQPEPAQPE